MTRSLLTVGVALACACSAWGQSYTQQAQSAVGEAKQAVTQSTQNYRQPSYGQMNPINTSVDGQRIQPIASGSQYTPTAATSPTTPAEQGYQTGNGQQYYYYNNNGRFFRNNNFRPVQNSMRRTQNFTRRTLNNWGW